MARTVSPSPAFRCDSEPVGMLPDKNRLYLQVTEGKHEVNRSWLFCFALNGKECQMGLGSIKDAGLLSEHRRTSLAQMQTKAMS